MDAFNRRANELARMRAGLIDDDDDDDDMKGYRPGQRSNGRGHGHPLVNEKSHFVEDEDENDHSAQPDLLGGMLKDIVEHEPTSVNAPSVNRLVIGSVEKGFPHAFKRNDQSINQSNSQTIRSDPTSKPRKSLFAMQRDLDFKKSINQSVNQLASTPINNQYSSSPSKPSEQQSAATSQPIDISDYSLIQSINQKYHLVNPSDVQSISRENEARLEALKGEGTLEQTINEFMSDNSLVAAMAKLRAKRGVASSANQTNQSVNQHPVESSISQPISQSSSSAVAVDVSRRSEFDRTYGQREPVRSVVIEDEKSDDEDEKHVHFDVDQTIDQTIDQMSLEEKMEWMRPAEATPACDWSKVDWATGLAYNYEQSINQSNKPSDDTPHGDAWLHWRVGFHGQALFGDRSDDQTNDGYEGLHHHADQPDRAGYTINELLHLTQSSVASQQSVSLLILSRVFDRVHTNQYMPPKGCSARIQSFNQLKQSNNQSDQTLSHKPVNINELVLEHLFARGAMTRIRLCLDSINQSVLTAAIRAIDSALGPHRSIDQLINQFNLFTGHFTAAPKLSQHAINQSSDADSPVVHDQSINHAYISFMKSDPASMEWSEVMSDNQADEQSINQCLICGLIQMNILPRLRFILVNQSVNQSITPLIGRILAHVAFHCESSARAINATDKLIDCLIDCSLRGDAISMLAVAACMKADRDQSMYLSNKGSLTSLREYMLKANGLPGQVTPVIHSVNQSINLFQCSTISLIIWRISLAYAIDQHDFLSFFPVLMTGVTRINQPIKNNDDQTVESNSDLNPTNNQTLSQAIKQQNRAMWNVFEGLFESLIEDEKLDTNPSANPSNDQSAKPSVEIDDDTGVSVTHLINAVDHALSLIPDAFNYSATQQTTDQSHAHSVISDLHSAAAFAGGLAHCVATYYQTINQTVYRQVQPVELTAVQIQKHRDTFFQSLDQSSLIQACVKGIQEWQSNTQAAHQPDNQFFCFPIVQNACEVDDLIDCLMGVGRWLNANLTLAQSINQSIKQSTESVLVSFVVQLITSLSCTYFSSSSQSTQPPVSLSLAFLLYEWLQVLRKLYGASWEQSINHSIYQCAALIVPVLIQGGRLYEAEMSIKQLLFAPASISWLQSRTSQKWKSEFKQSNSQLKCLTCDWNTKDFVGASGAHHTLSSIYQYMITSPNSSDSSKNQSASQSGKPVHLIKQTKLIVMSPAKRTTLSFPQSTSLLVINQSINQSNALHWLFMPLRDMKMFDCLIDPTQSFDLSVSQPMMVRQVRTFVQTLNWICETNILSANQSNYLVLTRASMELFVHPSRMYDDPSVSPSINHLTHLLVQSRDGWKFDSQSINQLRGWGGNFFPFFNRLVDSFTSEGLGDSNFAILLLFGLTQTLHVDYRIMLWSTLQRQAAAFNDIRIPNQALKQMIQPYETNKEVLSIYQSVIQGHDPIIDPSSDMFLVLANHLLPSWGCKNGMSQQEKAIIIKKKATSCNPNTINALIEFKDI